MAENSIYEKRPDVNVVVHTHPSYATAFAIVGMPLDKAIMPEVAIFFWGGGVSLAKYGTPSTMEIPDSVEEYYAELMHKTMAINGVREIAQNKLEELYKIRKNMNLPGKHLVLDREQF